KGLADEYQLQQLQPGSVLTGFTLSRALQKYCREHDIKDGVVFCTKNRKPLDRSNIWRDHTVL
ncbi:hypothetical protein NE462_27700, partial [Blautia hominis]|nr:hypothetical protein [Blautia hominis]